MYIPAVRVPSSTRRELAELTSSPRIDPELIVVRREHVWAKRAAIGGALVGLLIICTIAIALPRGLYGALPFLGISGLFWGLVATVNARRLRCMRRSRGQPATVISPHQVAVTGMDDEPIRAWRMAQLRRTTAFSSLFPYSSRSFVRLKFPDRAVHVYIPFWRTLKQATRQIKAWQAAAQEVAVDETTSTPHTDWTRATANRDVDVLLPGTGLLLALGPAVLLGVGLPWACFFLAQSFR